MREKFRVIPTILKKQIIIKILLGILSFVAVIIAVCKREVYLLLPSVALCFACAYDGISMLCNCLSKKYTVIEGICEDIAFTAFRKRVKYITIECEGCRVKIVIRQKQNKVGIGKTVKIYIPQSAAVYQYDEKKVICDFYALEAIK